MIRKPVIIMIAKARLTYWWFSIEEILTLTINTDQHIRLSAIYLTKRSRYYSGQSRHELTARFRPLPSKS